MANIKYTKEILEPIIAKSDSWAAVCRELGVKPFTGAQSHISRVAKKMKIDTSHFTGQAHQRGKKARNAKPTEFYLTKDSSIHSGKLRVRLIKDGYKEAVCEQCGLSEWLNFPIPLELHHLNGDHWDNRLNNLQILCPNCHSLK